MSSRQPNTIRSLTRTAAALLIAAAALGAPVHAQLTGGTNSKTKPVELKPPTPPSGNSGYSPLGPIGTGILLAALVIGMNFIPSKRGHQD